MANIRNANTFYVDATGNLTVPNIKVFYITITSTANSAVVVIKDVTTGALKFDLRIATAGDPVRLNYSDSPLVFPNGIDVTTLTNAIVTFGIQESQG